MQLSSCPQLGRFSVQAPAEAWFVKPLGLYIMVVPSGQSMVVNLLQLGAPKVLRLQEC